MKTTNYQRKNWYRGFAILAMLLIAGTMLTTGCGKKKSGPAGVAPGVISPIVPTCVGCPGNSSFLASGLGRFYGGGSLELELGLEFFGDAGIINSINYPGVTIVDPQTAKSYSGPVAAGGTLRILQNTTPYSCPYAIGAYEIRPLQTGTWNYQTIQGLRFEGVGPAHLVMSFQSGAFAAASIPPAIDHGGKSYPYKVEGWLTIESVNGIGCGWAGRVLME